MKNNITKYNLNEIIENIKIKNYDNQELNNIISICKEKINENENEIEIIIYEIIKDVNNIENINKFNQIINKFNRNNIEKFIISVENQKSYSLEDNIKYFNLTMKLMNNNWDSLDKGFRKLLRRKTRDLIKKYESVEFLEYLKKEHNELYEKYRNTENKYQYTYHDYELIRYYYENKFINDEEVIKNNQRYNKCLIKYIIDNNKSIMHKDRIISNILIVDNNDVNKFMAQINIDKIYFLDIPNNIFFDALKNNNLNNLSKCYINQLGYEKIIETINKYIKLPNESIKNENIKNLYNIIKEDIKIYKKIYDEFKKIQYPYIQYLILNEEVNKIENKNDIKKIKI